MTTEKSIKATIVDVHMPFLSMVGFMIKWGLAAVPAAIILLLLSSILGTILPAIMWPI